MSTTRTASTTTIRRATAADAAAIARLAALDSASPPGGDLLIAEVDGEPRAALGIATGAAIADPFRPTAHLVELLALRARSLAGVTPAPSRLRRLVLRTA